MANYDPIGTGEHPAPTEPTPWWEGPKPATWPANMPWPPELPPGASYGPNSGQIIYGPTTPGAPGSANPWTPDQPTPGVPPITPTVPPPTTTPPPPGGGPPPGGTIGDYTLPPVPGFTPPAYTPPPAFSYDAFMAPTGAEVMNDPGYQFRLQQGEQGLLNNRAARGLLNTGGTLKDFLNYNQNFATQEYGNVWDRAANTYKTNRGNALDTYNTNYQTQTKDPYDLSYQSALDQFAPQMKQWETQVSDRQHRADEERRYAWMLANG
jgi:hypothetical protein